MTGLADGTKNCWAVLSALESHCQTLECSLDWFHIGKKFQTVINGVGDAFEKSLESAKWKLWHGESEAALTKLRLLQDNITDETKKSKVQGLHEYLQNNLAYLVNYDEREKTWESLLLLFANDVVVIHEIVG